MLKIAFLFTNSKDDLIARVQMGQDADTSLHGLNHISRTDRLTVIPKSMMSLSFVPRLLRYDFVITQDNLLLGYVVSFLARVFGLKTRWLYISMTSSTLIRRHVSHPVRLFLLKMFWKSYFRIICLSTEQIEDFVRLGIARERLVFVPFGVDADFFKPTDVSHEEDLIVSVGRDAGRDYATLFRTAERTGHKYIVVATRKNIPTGVIIPANVTVLYERSCIEIRDLFKRAKLVVITSKDVSMPEGSDCSGQTVILDALAAGKAVIATRRHWITDYFIPDQDLVVVPSNDSEALAQAVDSLSRDVEKRKRLAKSGHSKVVINFTTKIFAEALLKIMDSI